MTRPPRKLSRNEQQRETRAALVSAALRLFARHGFDGTSIQAIAREAGFTRGAFYAHFTSKHEILGAAITERDALDRQRLRARIGTGTVARAAIADWIADAQHADLPFVALRLELVRNSLHATGLAQMLRDNQQAEVAGIAELLQQVARDLPLRPGITAPLAAQVISSFLDGVAIHALIDRTVDIRALWDALLVALTGDDGPPPPASDGAGGASA
ncbi:hypothetical protein BGC31_12555 [Komagataeibacter xylinus]|nr:transcriptional regulator, TetR family [Komagataeibacter xylinus E25]RFP05838.1 hypothetical protein BGC31_12555 [Komagataeibacter xylinus]RFP06094.1 hypothetical protein BFX83_05985 [Komagataeibacter xylinus]